MQVLLGAATLFFCCCRVAGPGSQDLGFRTWVSGPESEDSDRHNGCSCYSSHLGLLLFSCCLLLFFSLGTATLLLLLWLFFSQDLAPRTWLSGPGFQDSDRQTHVTHPTVVSSFSRHFSLRPVVTDRLRPVETKRKAKNQRKERLRPLLFPEENPSVRPSKPALLWKTLTGGQL
jgi:hypothetical protein